MDHTKSAMLHHSAWRMGRLLADHLKIFTIETTLEQRRLPVAATSSCMKREWEWGDQGPGLDARGPSAASRWRPTRLRHKIFTDIRAPYGLTGIARRRDRGRCTRRRSRTCTGSSWSRCRASPTCWCMGVPYLGPYNVNSTMNPILAACMGLGYYFNRYRGQPVVRKGGAVILYHPVERGVQPAAPPELRGLLRGGPRRVDRPGGRSRRSSSSSTRPTRGTSTCTGRRTPTTACTRSTCGTGSRTPWTTAATSSGSARTARPSSGWGSGPRRRSRTRSRWVAAPVGRSPSITYLHNPPHLLADVR